MGAADIREMKRFDFAVGHLERKRLGAISVLLGQDERQTLSIITRNGQRQIRCLFDFSIGDRFERDRCELAMGSQVR